MAPQFRDRLEPVQPWQEEVGQDERRQPVEGAGHQLGPVGRLQHLESGAGQGVPRRPAGRGVIVSEQNADRRHQITPVVIAPAGRVSGRVSVNVAPCPSTLSTPISPPWASTIFLTSDSPSPVPLHSRLMALSAR